MYTFGIIGKPWFEAGWWMAGPLPPDEIDRLADDEALDPSLSPTKVRSRESPKVAWLPMSPTADGRLGFRTLRSRAGGSGRYVAVLPIYSPAAQSASLAVKALKPVRVRLNGAPRGALQADGPHDHYAAPLPLRLGWNSLLLDVSLADDDDHIDLWLTTPDGGEATE